MSEAELIFTALAEMSTRQIAETDNANGLWENKSPAHKGGRIAKNARLELEEKTGKKVVTGQNFLGYRKSKNIEAIKKLAGSVKTPEKYKGMDIDEMIEKAKMEYFSKKKI